MGEVIEEYSIFYPLGGRGRVRLKVQPARGRARACLLYTSDAADEL